MARFQKLQLLLSFALIALGSSSNVGTTDQPPQPTIAATGDKSVISSYSSLLSSMSSMSSIQQGGPRGPPRGGRTPGALCNPCSDCTDCVVCHTSSKSSICNCDINSGYRGPSRLSVYQTDTVRTLHPQSIQNTKLISCNI